MSRCIADESHQGASLHLRQGMIRNQPIEIESKRGKATFDYFKDTDLDSHPVIARCQHFHNIS